MGDILSMGNYEDVLRLIALAIENKGWKPAKLAKEMGMSESWISRVMSGDIRLSVPMLLRIAETLKECPGNLLPVLPTREGVDEKPMTFQEYCRKIVREEVEKALQAKPQ